MNNFESYIISLPDDNYPNDIPRLLYKVADEINQLQESSKNKLHLSEANLCSPFSKGEKFTFSIGFWFESPDQETRSESTTPTIKSYETGEVHFFELSLAGNEDVDSLFRGAAELVQSHANKEVLDIIFHDYSDEHNRQAPFLRVYIKEY